MVGITRSKVINVFVGGSPLFSPLIWQRSLARKTRHVRRRCKRSHDNDTSKQDVLNKHCSNFPSVSGMINPTGSYVGFQDQVLVWPWHHHRTVSSNHCCCFCCCGLPVVCHAAVWCGLVGCLRHQRRQRSNPGTEFWAGHEVRPMGRSLLPITKTPGAQIKK